MKGRLARIIFCSWLAALLIGALSAAPATASALTIDTSGYSCTNGVCVFPSGDVSWSYSASITSAGGAGPTPYRWKVVTGALPAGLSLTPYYGVYSALVYGTPTKAQTASFTLQVKDGAGDTARQAFTLTIAEPGPPVISFPSSCCPADSVGTSYQQNFFLQQDTGLLPVTWSIAQGALPPGLSLSSSAPVSISGTPTTAGTFTFAVRVTDARGEYSDMNGSITIGP